MVRETKLKKSKLEACEGDSQRRDILLRDFYNLQWGDLINIRQGVLADRIFEAAKILYERTLDARQINTNNLAAMVYDEWKNPKQCFSYISHSLSKSFKMERSRKRTKYNFSLTYTQLLREEICGYSGNLYEARSHWKNFQPSSADWLRSVRIPLDIGFKESQLLGIYWADGNLNIRGNCRYLNLSGSKDDFEFYTWLGENIRNMHNIIDSIYENEREVKFKGKTRNFKFPSIQLGSGAIVTWLKNDLGFSKSKVNVSLPKLEWTKEQVRGFTSGIIAGMGGLSKYYNIVLPERDDIFLFNLYKLFKKIGIDSNLAKSRLTIEPNACKKIYLDGLLLHPVHIKKFNGKYGVKFNRLEDYLRAFEENNLIDWTFIERKRRLAHQKAGDTLRRKAGYSKLNEDQIINLAIDYIGGVKRLDILNKYHIGHVTFFKNIKKLKEEGLLTEQDLKQRRETIQRTIKEDTRLNVVADYLNGMSQSAITKKYGIHFAEIYRFFDEFKGIGLVNDTDMKKRQEKAKKRKEYPLKRWKEKILKFHDYLLQNPDAEKKDIDGSEHQYALVTLYQDCINDARREAGIPVRRLMPRTKILDERMKKMKKLRLSIYIGKNPEVSYKDIKDVGLEDIATEFFPLEKLSSVLKRRIKTYQYSL